MLLMFLLQHNLLHCTPITPIGGAAGPAAATAATGAAAAASAHVDAAASHRQQEASRRGPAGSSNSASNSASSSSSSNSAVAPQPHGGVRYSLNVHAALALLRFPAFAAITEELLGSNARLLLLQVFKAGRVCMQDAVALALADPCGFAAAAAAAAGCVVAAAAAACVATAARFIGSC